MKYSDFINQLADMAESNGDYPVLDSLPRVVFTRRIPTMATNATNIFVNPSWVDSLTTSQTLGVFWHELLHDLYGHHKAAWAHYDRNSGVPEGVWHNLTNIAMDIVINDTVRDAGYDLPSEGAFREKLDISDDLITSSAIFSKLLSDYKSKHNEDAMQQAMQQMEQKEQSREAVKNEREQRPSANGFPQGTPEASDTDDEGDDTSSGSTTSSGGSSGSKKQKQEKLDEQQEELDKQKDELAKQQEELAKKQEELDKQKADAASSGENDEESDDQEDGSGSGDLDKQQEELDKQKEELEKKAQELQDKQEELDKEQEELDAEGEGADGTDEISDDEDANDAESGQDSDRDQEDENNSENDGGSDNGAGGSGSGDGIGSDTDKVDEDSGDTDEDSEDDEPEATLDDVREALRQIVGDEVQRKMNQVTRAPVRLKEPLPPEQSWVDIVFETTGRYLALMERDRTYQRPGRRAPFGLQGSELLTPIKGSRPGSYKPRVCFYIDVSGSMYFDGDDRPNEIRAELQKHLPILRDTRSVVIPFNQQILQPLDVEQLIPREGGGTDIRNVIAHINSNEFDVSVIVTDADDSWTLDDISRDKMTVVVTNNLPYVRGDQTRQNIKVIGVDSF